MNRCYTEISDIRDSTSDKKGQSNIAERAREREREPIGFGKKRFLARKKIIPIKWIFPFS